MFDSGPVYLANHEAIAQAKKYIVNQGGTSSGKTYSLMQLLFVLASSQKAQVISVIGESIPNLKKGAYRDAQTIYASSDPLKERILSWNQTERIIYFTNGSVIEFVSFVNEQSAKNGKRDYAFFNEAQGVSYAIFWQVAIRTRKKVFLDYNPTERFWAHDKLIGKANTRLIISDHRHNLWLSKEQHDEIENEPDPELHRVYARGLTGKITGLIYRNWGEVDRLPDLATYVGTGLDFGFTNSPTAAHDIYMQNGELYIQEIIYEQGLDNPAIAKILLDTPMLAPYTRREVIADSAEPKSISEIANLGVSIYATTTKDIPLGIGIVKRYKLNIVRGGTGIKKELQSYKWKLNPLTGETTNEPIKKYDHGLDDVRYVALTKLYVEPQMESRAAGTRNRDRGGWQ